MWLTDKLFAFRAPGRGRKPQPPDATVFQAILPLKLKDRVSGKHDKSKAGDCLYEMSLVIACLKENDYENKLCQKEVSAFNGCYKKYLKETAESKAAQQKGILVPGDRNMTRKQISRLLKIRPML
ncbi:hypothetical protein TKK_0006565 [Trichogramma kaykai]|uniref:CHCH domain-containing protein n=1 Tax=Trichogramma kaykai TaxID=54128 RepID=A0ABD2XCQ2_9HYME